jgi:hypothetical protein
MDCGGPDKRRPAEEAHVDRAIIERHLAAAEEHVALGEKTIANQRRVLENLLRDGHDTAIAEKLLTAFLDTQDLHIADRNRLREELAQSRR